jgi:CHAT domain-containing protein/Tfp pilus assembly protein PilF
MQQSPLSPGPASPAPSRLARWLATASLFLWIASARPAAQTASLASYQPRLQQLQSSADWAGLEQLARQALDDMKLHGSGLDVQRAAMYLGNALHQERHNDEAEALYRSLLASDLQVLGPNHALTAAALGGLGIVLVDQARYPEAEPLLQRALAIREQILAPQDTDIAQSLNDLAWLYLQQGRLPQAEPLLRRALSIAQKAFGPDDPFDAVYLENLALVYRQQGEYAHAEELYQRALSIAKKAHGPEHPDVARNLNELGVLYSEQGLYPRAEAYYQNALAIEQKALGPEHVDVGTMLGNLGALYQNQGRYAQAEPLQERALAIMQSAFGPEHPQVATALANVASMHALQGQYAQAEPLFQRSLAIREKSLGPDSPNVGAILRELGSLYQQQGQYARAEPLLRRSLTILQQALGPDHPDTALVHEFLGGNDVALGRFGDAVANYRLGCSSMLSVGRLTDLNADAARAVQQRANGCSTQLSLALWNWAAQGGGDAASDRPEALRLEAFGAGQRAVHSAAGDAMARSAALTAARGSAVGPQAQAYEAALRERDNLDQIYARAAAEGGKQGILKSTALARARDELVATIDRLATELKTQAPRYWDYRSPEPVSVAALQAHDGADAALLHDDEALVLFMVAPGDQQGLVFAVSRQQLAWARLGMSGAALQARVMQLRSQIDPQGYGLRAIAVHGTATSSSSPRGGFDRLAAYQLYQALLAAAPIQAVIRDKPVLLFVPSGPLTALPPGLLVTSPPPDGVAHDGDPASLRATSWLLRSKAVALLPAVSSLRTLRQILPANRASTTDPLLVFADPDFRRLPAAPKALPASAVTRSFSSYFRDGVPLADALLDVPALPGTRVEGVALEQALHGKPGSLLTGRDASKAELMARNADGRLAKVRVLEFATHGLVAGEASDLAEPALLLAAGAAPEDELLLASQAATLTLNADWVLLSACNTASPDAPEAQGLSGLSRAFFYAGARSLLVSHWRVRDDVAPLLIPAMLLAERDNPTTSRAQALRQATLAILDNRSLNASDPAAWAPFTLVGEAGR